MGNYVPSLKDPTITVTGEANANNGPVIIRLNFRNPVDIDPVTGDILFSKTNVSFSGIYQVRRCRSSFKDGAFKQQLALVRYNGQIADDSDEKENTKKLEQESKPGEQQVTDTAPADVARFGIKLNDVQLTSLIQRGLPTSGLPGDGANLAGILKKTSGALGPGMSVLNQASDIFRLSIGDSLSGIDPLAKGISIGAESLASLGLALPASASAMGRIGDTVNGILPGPSSDILNSSVGSSMGGSIGKLMDATQNLNLESIRLKVLSVFLKLTFLYPKFLWSTSNQALCLRQLRPNVMLA
jgi:hypothetical protein